jgi:hypothetical protein
MRIAEEIVKNGMSAGTAFTDALTGIIYAHSLKKIIETGSYKGEGTTAAIRRAMSGDEQVYSIEVNPTYHHEAEVANGGSGIHFLLGLSIGNAQIPVDTTFNVPDWVVVDHQPEYRSQLYNREVMHKVPDHMLDYALAQMDHRPDLVILDSAGHMGYIEFRYLMERVHGDFFLALDDTNHVKHYETCQVIKDDPRFSLVFNTIEKFGSRIYRVTERQYPVASLKSMCPFLSDRSRRYSTVPSVE